MSTTVTTFAELPGLAGTDLGYTDYVEVDQTQIDTFADATDDHQWLHVDPVKAKDGPFGTTVAHGFLTLALAIPFWTELLDVTDVTTKVNYGLDKVRFPAPVTVGSKIRMRATIASVTEIAGGVQLGVDQTIEIEGGTKPAVVAHGLYRFYV
ncbi:MaoC family dehydratase [Cryobacterium sp. TMS1-20-1]|uniref:MaoC family dehydratase n=1 Tax=Cryobacterium sp. TMS1-20-1 TaxID=1259223 RepID=UPI00106C3F6A|nr:MaoC family dehydratase [Cryobacterium sp. TMS1-20-1]TFC72465.1 MaoC family dehydratase [Cryobacterium sp. TMS1-20-1]